MIKSKLIEDPDLKEKNLYWLKIVGHIFFGILIFYSIFYYKERTLYIDPAFQIFDMINTRWFSINSERYSMVINEIIPLITIWLNLPLQWILISYSLSFILVYYLCFILAVYRFKSFVAGLSFLFTLVLIREMFVHSISETWLGLAYCSLFYAIINYQFHTKSKIVNRILYYVWVIPIIVICYYIHSITLFPLVFLLVYNLVDKKEFSKPKHYVTFLFILILFSYKFLIGATGHEEQFFSELKNYKTYLPQLAHANSTRFFFSSRISIYYLLIIPLIVIAIGYIKRKEYLKSILVNGSFVFIFLVLLITFFKGDSVLAMETRFLPLSLIVFLPLTNDFLQNISRKWLTTVVLFFLFYSFIGIAQSMNVYTQRFKTLQNLVKQGYRFDNQKLYCSIDSALSSNKLMVKWGVAIETTLYSSMINPENPKTIFLIDDEKKIEPWMLESETSYFFTPWWIYRDISEINPTYFQFQKNRYQRISSLN